VSEYLFPLLDIANIGPDYVGPEHQVGEDVWGVIRQPISYGEGAYAEIHCYPLASAHPPGDPEQHTWPDPDWWDCSSLGEKCRQAREPRDYALIMGNGNIFETSWYMRGFERMFVDLVINPELARAIFRRVTHFYKEYFRRALAAAEGKIGIVFSADDIGGQQGLLMSLAMWKEFLQPYHQELNTLLHEFDIKIMYHSDGSVTEAVPGLVEMGIDCLQACQFSAENMDPVFLKESYGGRLCFEGGVSVQTTLPFGRVEDVESEVRERVRVLAQDGGYISGPSHAIQADTPPENIVAMFDTALNCPMA